MYEPGEQGTQGVLPSESSSEVPAGQGWHTRSVLVVALTAVCEPAGQVDTDWQRLLMAKVPLAHGAHTRSEVWVGAVTSTWSMGQVEKG